MQTPDQQYLQLTDDERAIFQWQLWMPEFGEEGQRRLKSSAVLVSRVGGIGGTVALYLAAAGVGKLVLAHAGNLRPDDLNRQILMTSDWIGRPRIESAKRRLLELNPRLEIVAVEENIAEENAANLVAQADMVVSCAPLFEERLLLNREAVKQKKPLIDCAMYETQAQLVSVRPGETACLACLYPEIPPAWKREFPVIGAVCGTVASLGAMEAIKSIAGFGESLAGTMLMCDLREMSFRRVGVRHRKNCKVCGTM